MMTTYLDFMPLRDTRSAQIRFLVVELSDEELKVDKPHALKQDHKMIFVQRSRAYTHVLISCKTCCSESQLCIPHNNLVLEQPIEYSLWSEPVNFVRELAPHVRLKE